MHRIELVVIQRIQRNKTHEMRANVRDKKNVSFKLLMHKMNAVNWYANKHIERSAVEC